MTELSVFLARFSELSESLLAWSWLPLCSGWLEGWPQNCKNTGTFFMAMETLGSEP